MHLWYNAADLFCLMSEKEGWPNVLLESLACGVPVVASAAGGIPEIVSSENIGLLTDREEAGIAKSIRHAFAKSWNADELVEHARKFSWDSAAQRLYEIFAKSLSATAGVSARREPSHGAIGNHDMARDQARVDAATENRRVKLR
jgi:glycosyltransferase involved in cell wall biosynthesis